MRRTKVLAEWHILNKGAINLVQYKQWQEAVEWIRFGIGVGVSLYGKHLRIISIRMLREPTNLLNLQSCQIQMWSLEPEDTARCPTVGS